MDKKPWQSKTIWLNAICGLLAATAAFWPGATPINAWIASNLPMIGMLWGVLGMALRLITKDKIVLLD